MSKCLIITGGTIDISFARDFLQERRYDRVIAVDAGLEALRHLHLMMTLMALRFILTEIRSSGSPPPRATTRAILQDEENIEAVAAPSQIGCPSFAMKCNGK